MKVALAFEFDGSAEATVSDVGTAFPLVIDLDGTLLRTDLLLESILHYLKRNPLGIFMMLWWVCRGIARLKHELATRSDLRVDLLPINEELVDHAREAARLGRPVIVATAANRTLAEKVCARFEFIGEVLASSARTNFKGQRKAAALSERFPQGFAYAGDSRADLAVWSEARLGIFAGRDPRLLDRLQRATTLEADFAAPRQRPRDWVRACRLHQWAKNALVFLPLMLAGHLLDQRGWTACLGAFLAMGVVASATYLVNDLLDLEADRQHWSKRSRPIANGTIGIPHAVIGAIVLLAAGLGLAVASGGPGLAAALLLYCTVTLGYSLYIKRIPVLDVTTLAALFTLRLGIGAVAAEVRLSAWLAVFSMFLFLSLALAKRSTEMGRKCGSEALPSHGRGYLAADAPLVASLGVSSALGAVLLMVLYLINEAFVGTLYRSPDLLWAAPVFIGLWLGRVWLLCGRGLLHDDPVAFAVTDRTSIALGLGVVASFGGAALIA